MQSVQIRRNKRSRIKFPRKTVSKNSDKKPSLSLFKVNEIKFAEFAKDKAHQTLPKKKLVSFFSDYGFGTPIGLLPNFITKDNPLFENTVQWDFEITVGKDFIFNDGVYQEFYKYFQKNLQYTDDLNVVNAFRKWINSKYLKGKVGRPKVYRDSITGIIYGLNKKSLRVIELFIAGNKLEQIRRIINPKTKSFSKKKTEINQINRILRENKDLLIKKV